MYGKKVSKPKRKLGHINLVAKNGETINDLLQKLSNIKDKIQIRELVRNRK